MTIPIWAFVLIVILCPIIGIVAGLFIAKFIFQKQLKENPPINRDMIKAMYKSMGVNPSEARLNQTMKAIDDASKKSKMPNNPNGLKGKR